MRVLSLAKTPGRHLLAHLDGVDLIEWRLDLVPFATDLMRRLPRPWIATLRHASEGGHWDGTDEERCSQYKKCLDAGARWLDVEATRSAGSLPVTHLLRSCHLKADTTDERRKGFNSLVNAHGALAKWVSPVDSCRDLCSEEQQLAQGTRQTIIIHMGAGGTWTRLRPPAYPWTYVATETDDLTGPGQFTLSEHRALGREKLYGILGWPVDHSLSPALHNQLFCETHTAAAYVHVPIRKLNSEFMRLRDRFDGFSITAPHKTAALKFADHIDDIAQAVGAINTLTRKGQSWQATNTDAVALKQILANNRIGPHQHMTVVGAGGFARAALWAGRELEIKMTVVNRSPETTESCAKEFGAQTLSLSQWNGAETDVLVQATPVPKRIAQQATDLNPTTLVIESIYDQPSNWLGHPLVSGREVFATQAAEQARLWTGQSFAIHDLLERLP